MARLTTAARAKLPASAFAEPKSRKYPIEDKAHARDALARVGEFSPSQRSKILAKVHKKFPTVDKKKGC
jgi:hypothetical protein